MKVRACWRCWKYMDIHPDDAQNGFNLKEFDRIHKNHGVLTLNESEVLGRYQKDEIFNSSRPSKAIV